MRSIVSLRNPRRPRAVVFAVLALAALGLSQCHSVNDRVTGVDIGSPGGLSARRDCVRSCNRRLKDDLRAEHDRFLAAFERCGTSAACRKFELRVHVARVTALVEAAKRCKRSCYNEGAGFGG
jgi:hypothetical protein